MERISKELFKKYKKEGVMQGDFAFGNIYPRGGITHDDVSTMEESRKIKFNSYAANKIIYDNNEFIICEVSGKGNGFTNYYILDNFKQIDEIEYKEYDFIDDKQVIEWLNKVRREGIQIARYDKQIDSNEYDDTESVFIYRYKEVIKNKETEMEIFIIMRKGDYIDYNFKYLED